MARLNIEDSIFKDKRFIKLTIKLGGLEPALGALVYAWMIAQKYYLTEEKMIPKTIWDEQELNPFLIEIGLAEEVGDYIRVKGSDEQFSWLEQRKSAGKSKKQNQYSPRKSTGYKKKWNGMERNGTKVNEMERNGTEWNEMERNGTSYSYSFSNSNSNSNSFSLSDSLSKKKQNEEIKKNYDRPNFENSAELVSSDRPTGQSAPLKNLNSQIWNSYREAYLARYQVEPVRNAIVNTQIKNLAARLGQDAVEVVKFYLTHNDSFFVKQLHPVGLCLASAESLRTQWVRGKAITSSDVKSFEKSNELSSLLKHIKENGV